MVKKKKSSVSAKAKKKKSSVLAIAHCPDGGIVTPVPSNPAAVISGTCEISPISQDERADEARRLRLERAYCAYRDSRCETDSESPICTHPCNGDEAFYYQSPELPDGTPNPYLRGISRQLHQRIAARPANWSRRPRNLPVIANCAGF